MNKGYKRDTEYWNKFYSQDKKYIAEHSLFAEYIMGYLKKGCDLLDIGCGNGRDSIWFANNGVKVSCIDASDVAINSIKRYSNETINAICGDFVNSDVYNACRFDVVYSRFSVHAIDETQEDALFNNVYKCLKEEGIFAIEVRSIHDDLYEKGHCVGRNAYVFEEHYRRFIEINEITRKLMNVGFTIQYSEENINFAPFKDSNPRVIRVIAKKNNLNEECVTNLFEKFNKLIFVDDVREEYICDIVKCIEKKQLLGWHVFGTKNICVNTNLYTKMSNKQFENVKELINTYEVSDKLIFISEKTMCGTLLNYIKTGLLTEDEMIQALLYKQ